MPELRHKMVGGFHVFTSPDVPGLYVADPDRAKAEANVRPTIDALERMTVRRANVERVRAMVAGGDPPSSGRDPG